MATPISQIMPLRMKGQMTCSYHKGRQLDFFCEKCCEPVCPKCLSSVHKGHIVCEISEITPQKEPVIKNFIDTTEKKTLVQIGKYINSTDSLLKDNTSTFEKLSQKLKMQTDKLKQELDMLTAQTLFLYHKMEEDNTKLIKKYKKDMEMYEEQLKEQIQECKAALQRGSHIQIYETFCEILSPTYSLPVKPVLGTANFNPNEKPQHHLKKALGKVITSGQGQTLTDQNRSVSMSDDLGQPSTQQQRSETKVKKAVTTYTLLPQTKVVEEWESPCLIGSICPTTDGQVWITDEKTRTLLDRKGKVIQEVKHNVCISAISLSPTTHTLWVCDRDNNIMELVSGRLTHRFSTKEEPWCICITASNHAIVGMPRHISKFTSDGDIPSTYRPTPQTRGKPFYPSDVVYDSVGNLTIGDYNNYRVVLISGGGEFLRIVHTDTCRPWAVGVDREDVLWVVFGLLFGFAYAGNTVKLLQYSSVCHL
ncbi:uncharacterized protein LOC110464334 [Mizuhopecten yessoensis]|uniref:uncharacterized protein LOC110464334 n=1 Tax=Mizuhopecten yessoensis TaxID=6573 RepID=UPI000B4592E7|nr:uncharacterized protein LOC110464334 [Mizuhopecten yessoensis]